MTERGNMKTFKELRLNWTGAPFRGSYVNRGGDYVSIDDLELISHIEDNLYVGGCIGSDANVEDFFSHIFSLYKWEKYEYDKSATQHHEVTMYDSAKDPVDVANVEGMSDEIVYALSQGGNVLVHCQAGINRSNLVAVRVLMKWKGLTASEAANLLRDKRHHAVLSNRTFFKWLLAHDKEQ